MGAKGSGMIINTPTEKKNIAILLNSCYFEMYSKVFIVMRLFVEAK